MDAGFQRRPAAQAPDRTSDQALLARIVDEIRGSGPMTFARFMELALYAPQLGYYTSPATRIGRRGDFLTAPELHPIFGAAIARFVAATWEHMGRPASFAIREYGAGTGALARATAAALAADAPDLARALRYEAVEINPQRREDLEASWPPEWPIPLATLDPATARTARPTSAGIVLANEFLDAFPVHVVEQADDGLREVHVAASSATELVATLRAPSTPLLAEQLTAEGVVLTPGQRAEVAVGLDGWFAEVAGWLGTGVALAIDYGAAASDLFGAPRPRGTVVGYVGHQVVDDPLVAVGRQDLTAHVDFTAVDRAAQTAGLTPLGFTTQAAFLVDLGLEELLERRRSDPSLGLGDYLELRSALARLLDPRHTGGFRVLALGRGVGPEPPLPGLRRLAK
jgi:SAM-dependent MidA family methyltransferase